MPADATTTRPRTPAPPRLIVVGSDLAHRVRTAIDEFPTGHDAHIVAVPSFLAAIGEVGRTGGDAVIGPVTSLQTLATPIADALRHARPGLRLVCVAPIPDDPSNTTPTPRDASRAGFSKPLSPDIQPGELAHALGLSHLQPLTHSTPHPLNPSPSDPATLGDTDLVEAILAGGPILPLAMQLMAQHAQIPGLDFRAAKQTTPDNPHHDDRHTATVAFADQTFGQLSCHQPQHHADAEEPSDEASGATGATGATDTLASWAAWLARWLALDRQLSRYRDLSQRDELTGIWNRRYFNSIFRRILAQAERDRQQVTLLVYDIDDFKLYNDRFGHAAGDEILRETARLMQTSVRDGDVVARIGGDEFAVIFWEPQGPRRPGSRHPEDVLTATRRFQEALSAHRFPKLGDEAPGPLTVSGGLASYPWDGQSPDALLETADQQALRAKRQGKNVITFGPGEQIISTPPKA